MAEEKPKVKQATPKTYAISSEQLMDIMKYLMTRPYAEVYALMHIMTTLKPVESNGGKDGDKK